MYIRVADKSVINGVEYIIGSHDRPRCRYTYTLLAIESNEMYAYNTMTVGRLGPLRRMQKKKMEE